MTPDASTCAQSLLEAIDVQQNELLDQLDALNLRIETLLNDCLRPAPPLQVMAEPA